MYLDRSLKSSNTITKEIAKSVLLAGVAEVLAQGQNVVIIGSTLRNLVEEDLSTSEHSKRPPSLSNNSFEKEDNESSNSNFKWNDVIIQQQLLTKDLVSSFELTKSCYSKGDSWSKVMLEYQSLASQNSTAFLEFATMSSSVDSNLDKLDAILEIVSKAKSLYNPKFRLLETVNPFCESIFIENERQLGLSVLLKYLSNYIIKAELIAQRFVEFYSKLMISLGLERTLVIEKNLKQLYKLKTSPISLSRKNTVFKEVIEAISDLEIEGSFSVSEYDTKSLFEFNRSLDHSIKQIGRYSKNPTFGNSDYIKSINTKNHQNKELIKIEKDLVELIKSIEDSQIFKKTIESNSISSLKKYQSLLEIITFLQLSRDQLEDMEGFYSWKTFIASIPKFHQKLIKALHSSNIGNWEELTKTWYYKTCIQRITKFDSQKPVEQFKRYEEFTELIESDYIGIIESLVESKQVMESEDSLQQVTGPLTTSKSNKHVQVQKYSDAGKSINSIRYISSIPSDLEHNTIYITSGQDLRSNHESSVYQINISNDGNVQELIHHTQVLTAISQESIDRKLSLARILSNALLYASSRVNCFITQSSNIIVDCAEEILSLIVDQWQGERLKSIRLGSDQSNGLIEFLLNDSANGVYIYDYIDASSYINLYDHLQKIKALQSAGYHTVYFDPISMANSQDYAYEFQELVKLTNS